MTLHIYGQPAPHSTVYIVGDVDGLRTLRNAIDYAIASTDKATAVSCAADGEGFVVQVKSVNPSVMPTMMLPYTDAIYSAKENEGTPPYRILQERSEDGT